MRRFQRVLLGNSCLISISRRNSPSSPHKFLTQAQGGFTLKVNSELVLTNVVVRDSKTGELVSGLKASDFSVSKTAKNSASKRLIMKMSIWLRR